MSSPSPYRIPDSPEKAPPPGDDLNWAVILSALLGGLLLYAVYEIVIALP
jgi:hypothetical protein